MVFGSWFLIAIDIIFLNCLFLQVHIWPFLSGILFGKSSLLKPPTWSCINWEVMMVYDWISLKSTINGCHTKAGLVINTIVSPITISYLPRPNPNLTQPLARASFHSPSVWLYYLWWQLFGMSLLLFKHDFLSTIVNRTHNHVSSISCTSTFCLATRPHHQLSRSHFGNSLTSLYLKTVFPNQPLYKFFLLFIYFNYLFYLFQMSPK